VGLGPAPSARITVPELFSRHMEYLARLPGEVSEFGQSQFGYEWRCEFELGAAAGPDGLQVLHLQFSLIDLEPQLKPAAVLYLLVQGPERGDKQRWSLPLEDPAETHEQLNQALASRDASLEILANAQRFIDELAGLKDFLAWQVSWI
jgi:hypothetical protein